MKIIYPDIITSVAADEENAAYPATNLQDNHPNKVWRATSRDAVVTVQVAAGANAVAVFSSNALTVSVSLYETEESVEWNTGIEWDTNVEWFENSGAGPEYSVYDLSSSNEGAFWAEYATRYVPHQLTLTFTAAIGEIVEAGVIAAGASHSFNDPQYGIQEGLIDYSIIKKLANGAFYIKAQDVVRTFTGEITLTRDSDFYTFMLDIARALGPNPFACRISTNVTNWEWVVYARFDGLPQGVHGYPDDSEIQFSLLEVL